MAPMALCAMYQQCSMSAVIRRELCCAERLFPVPTKSGAHITEEASQRFGRLLCDFTWASHPRAHYIKRAFFCQ